MLIYWSIEAREKVWFVVYRRGKFWIEATESVGLRYVHVRKCSVTVTVWKGQLCRSCCENGSDGRFEHILSIRDFPFLVVRFY